MKEEMKPTACPLCDARARLEKAEMLAGELIAMIRVNAMRGTFATATIEEIDEFLTPRVEQLRAIQNPTPEPVTP